MRESMTRYLKPQIHDFGLLFFRTVFNNTWIESCRVIIGAVFSPLLEGREGPLLWTPLLSPDFLAIGFPFGLNFKCSTFLIAEKTFSGGDHGNLYYAQHLDR